MNFKSYLVTSILAVSLICNATYAKSVTAPLLVECPVSKTVYSVCFTPGQACSQDLVNVINSSTKSIFVQAYSFTSAPIAKSLFDAFKRGVNIEIILDKSQVTAKYSSAVYFSNANIPLWIDYKPAIAHNKIMIIDGHLLVTGSYNFTAAAQTKNAENMLIIDNIDLANKYMANWNNRKTYSILYSKYKIYKNWIKHHPHLKQSDKKLFIEQL
jgi:phosphatidylserine/phosphatidylglycerophosphate/cardiolipin synthase-like enzyme